MKKYKDRNSVPEKYKWDLSIYFKNDDEFNKECDFVSKKINDVKKYVGCTNDSSKLKEFLDLNILLSNKTDAIYIYSMLMDDIELGKKESLERKIKAVNIIKDFELNISFFIPELMNLSKDAYNKLTSDNILLKYKVYLDRIYREKDHVLSENEEKIITELTSSMNNLDDISSTMLNSIHNYGKININGEVEEIATNNIRKLLKEKEESIRKKVYNSFNKKLDEYSSINAMLLNNYVRLNISLARIRNFNSSWEEKLFNLNLSDKVFTSLRSSVEENINVLHKYYDLRNKVLGFKEKNYDINVELTKSNKKYTIEEAQELLLKALSPLGSDYIKHFKRIFDERHVDYVQYKGKMSGAYSVSLPDKEPRILMSFNNDLDSISTLAHEGGHDVHHLYIMENNEIMYRYVKTIVAEVASLTNECILSNYIVNNSKEKEEKLAGLENILRVIVSNLFGAVREAKIEQDMYKYVEDGGSISKEYMDDLTKKSLEYYYGDEVNCDKYVKNSWVTRSHYYMFYYLYSYAISISVATYVASKIIKKEDNMLEKYIKFLSTGGDIWPIDAFKVLGIDLEDKSVYEEAIKYFDSLLDSFINIYNE